MTSFAGDALKLVSGTAFAQLLGIVASPILTRLYAPEVYGIMALFTSITSIIIVIASMRYELAIMLPETDEEAANLLGVSIGLAVLISLLTVLVIWWGREPLLRLFKAEQLRPYLWLVPLTVLLGGVFTALNYWNSRTRHFGRLSIARVFNSLTTTAIALGGGFAGHANVGTMMSAGIVGQAVTTSVLGWQIYRDGGRLFLHSIRWKEMIAGIRRFQRFPLFGIWSALLNTVSWQLPVLLLARYFSSTVVGYYALGFRILQIPMSVIGGAIAQAFFPRAAEARVQGALTALVDSMFVKLVMVGIFPILTLGIIGQDLYTLAFGAVWSEAGIYTQILSLWAFFWFISSPLSTLLSVLELQRFELAFNTMLLVARGVALSVGGEFRDARLAIFLFSAVGLVLYAYLCVALLTKSGVSVRRIAGIFGRSLLIFSPFGVILAFVVRESVAPWSIIVVAAILALGYYLGLYKLQPDILRLK
jgi:O-antigen/teichoic acid export membrane protein